MTLKELLKEKDLTAAWLSRRVGVSSAAVGMWVNGETMPGIIHARKIAKALNVTTDEVIDCFVKAE